MSAINKVLLVIGLLTLLASVYAIFGGGEIFEIVAPGFLGLAIIGSAWKSHKKGEEK